MFGLCLARAAGVSSRCRLSSSRTAIRSIDPAAAPAIAPNYLATEADRQTAARAIRITREIVAQPALARFCPTEVRPGADYQSDEDLERAAGEIGTTIFHPVGTAAMGSVVDTRLRVTGIAGLRVIDASVMPSITSGNTNAPTMMIAEKGAEMLLKDAK